MGCVVNEVYPLSEIGSLCVDLTRWYDELDEVDGGDARELEGLLARIRALPALPGRLGAALALLEQGAIDDTSATVAAFVDIADAARRYRHAVERHQQHVTRPAPSAEPRRAPAGFAGQGQLFEPERVGPDDGSGRS